MSRLKKIVESISEVDFTIGDQTQTLLDDKTKPQGSLGRLEELACRIASIRGIPKPELPRKAILVMAGDHGVYDEGVSAFPQEVTGQMILNFANGGAAINALAQSVGAKVVVVDIGTKYPPPTSDSFLSRPVRTGTANFTKGPAMTREEALRALEIGITITTDIIAEGVTLVGLGEMGIGNTTASSALLAAFTGLAPADITGRGTGIDDAGLRRKIDAISRALETNRPDATDAIDTLSKVGGLEIAGLAGAALACAANRIPVVIDGFISSVAALVAARIIPKVTGYLIASHRSVEVGHHLVLDHLELKPLFDLGMGLGEGTGAALAMGLIDASLNILHEMSTFGSAGVSERDQGNSSKGSP